MFLFERLAGVGTFAIILVFVCFLISICKNNKSIGIILFLYTIILSIMGFFFVPYITTDLYRIYEYLDYFRTLDFKTFFETYQNSSVVGGYVFYWLISKTGENRLLTAVSAFISFSCIFYLLRKTIKKYNISSKNVAITLFFIMATGVFITTTGVRTIMSISLVAFCFFRETVEKKFRLYHILLYVIAAFMHNFTVVIILIRLLIPLFDNTKRIGKKTAYIISLGGIIAFMAFNMKDLLDAVYRRAQGYISGNAYSYFWGYIIGALILLAVLISLIQYSKIQKEENKDLNQFKLYSIVLMVISVAFSFEYSIFARTSSILLPIMYAPCFMLSLEKSSDSKRNNMIILLVAILVVSFLRGEMSAYKFFVL